MSKHQVIGLLALACFLPAFGQTRADSIYARRNPRFASLYEDNRARYVGDVLTINLSENTTSRGQESRDFTKNTRDGWDVSFTGDSNGDVGSRTFAGRLTGSGLSQRRHNARAETKIERKFIDRMSVTVVGVEANGNLLIEGYRDRLVAQETRAIRVTGIVRPVDIGPGNIVTSDYIANLHFSYVGRGQESAYQDNGWWGKVLNRIWPW